VIYLELFLGFLEVGLFSFGGAYAAIPLIRDVVMRYGWVTEEELLYFIAVSESTPGPIMVNLATYVGSSQAGILGAAIATLTVILPAFLIILIVVKIMERFMKNRWVKGAMSGLKPCVMGIILATGVYMVASNALPGWQFDLQALIITAVLAAALLIAKLTKKKLSPILLIVLAAVAGMVVYAI
jgi:chromate transporter